MPGYHYSGGTIGAGGTIGIDATVDLKLRLTDGRWLGRSGEFGSQLAIVVGGSVLVV